MIFVSVETVDSSSALRVATRWIFVRSAAISSSLAITVPHSWASTDSRKVSSSDGGLVPAVTRKSGLSADGGPSGNAHHEESSPISNRLGAVSPASASQMLSGARS